MSKWWAYQKERFPVFQHAPLVFVFSFSGLCYSSLLRDNFEWPEIHAIATAFLVALLFFLQLRIADEFKDFEEDSQYRPYRPVPRGLVTLRQLGGLFVIAGAIQLWLTWTLYPPLVWLLAVAWTYLAAMSKEFFVREWLEGKPVTYLLTHMGIMPLIDLFITSCDWRIAGLAWPGSGIYWFLMVSFFNGILIEFGRKIRAPEDEEEGVRTYSVLWGRKVAVYAWLAAIACNAIGAILAAGNIGFLVPAIVILTTLFAIAGLDRNVLFEITKNQDSETYRDVFRDLDLAYVSLPWTAVLGNRVARKMNETPMILQSSDRHEIGSAGGKALALWRLREKGLPIPQWFVITPAAFKEGKLCEEATQLIRDNLISLGLIDKPLAVRSSSVEEDAASSSFAGQFESFLGITANELEEAAVKVWNSGYADRVDAYKDARGEKRDFQPLAVIVQELIASEVAGVAFSVDPVSANWDNALVSAVVGLGSTLVDGESDADMYTIDRSDRELSREIAHKSNSRRVSSSNGFQVVDEELSDFAADQACLSQEQARDIARLSRQCEAYFGRPQDIEWAIAKGELYLLQSRPITTLQNLADARGKLYIWDNSNIAESYSGITLPLTFSFARYIYTEVYRQFCLLLNVPSKRIAQHRALFGQMLGSIRGRVYYNLISWYKVLALLPGYSLNRGFMEQMMGVKESLSDEAQCEVDVVKGNGKFIDGLNLSRSLIGLLWKHWTIERDVRRFYVRLDQALGRMPKPMESMRLEELADHFHDLERDLLTSWDAPLVNDFIAMIFFGALKSLCEKWVGGESDSLHNDLICEMGNIISAEPAKRIRKMAIIAAKDDSLCELLRSGRIGEIRKAIEQSIELKKEVDSYFEKFGDRCLDELKLESLALVDDPLLLYRSIGELAVRQSSDDVGKGSPAKDTRQVDAEAQVFGALKGSPLKKALFRYVLKHARRRVSGRENLRFERTKLFGRIRRIFLEMGKRLSAFNVLDDPRDIFYLEIYEIIGYIEGSGPTTNLKGLVELRRQEYDGYASERGPDDRFETKGAVPIGNRYQSGPRTEAVQKSGADLQGIGCCPGVVRGVARVVTNPQVAQLKRGEILVAKQTDPGWIMLFPLASGLLVERGSLLSHSAIVSRELGLPAVVSIRGLLDTLKTGDEIELDGSKGIVRILKRVEDTDDAPQ